MLWDADKLLRQLALGEDSRVKFKEVVFTGSRVREPRCQRIANELAAFGNTLGGALIFSVSDAGEVRPMSRECSYPDYAELRIGGSTPHFWGVVLRQ